MTAALEMLVRNDRPGSRACAGRTRGARAQRLTGIKPAVTKSYYSRVDYRQMIPGWHLLVCTLRPSLERRLLGWIQYGRKHQ